MILEWRGIWIEQETIRRWTFLQHDWNHARNLFAQAGTIDSVHIITDRETGRAKGFGFVEMSTEDEAARAISMFNGTDFEGRNITVNEAKPQTDRPQRSSGGYDSRRGGGRY